MVGIVTGADLGLNRSFLKELGSRGELGNGSFGINGTNVLVNVANGNLIIEWSDVILTGVELDAAVSLNYNSL